MFENVIGQEAVVDGLRNDVHGDTLPGSLLFYGPPYSGKGTAALELARVLTCEEGTAAWNCSCRSCELHRRLIHPNILVMGSRYFPREIAACAEVFRRYDKPSTRYLFIRSIRKLTRRFDPVLWEGNDAKLKKVQSLLSEVEEQIEFFYPGVDHPDQTDVEKRVEALQESCLRILQQVNLEGIPVDQIRKTNLWAQTTGASRKIVIIENADEMLPGARNALLKTLEEPVPGVYFILITTRKHGIIPTLASRLRPYRFIPRDRNASEGVLTRIFREEPGRYESLREFFLAYGVNLDLLRSQVRTFLGAVSGEVDAADEIRSLFEALKKEGSYRIFLEELTRRIREYDIPFTKGVPEETLTCREAWMREIRETLFRFEALNQSVSLSAEHLLYAMRKEVPCGVS